MAQKKMVDVFDLDNKELKSEPEVKGSYSKVLMDIRNGIIRRTQLERERADKSGPMLPLTVHGKLVLPKMEEAFVVRVTNRRGERILLLFSWHNLYNKAFFVETDNKDKRCWYYFDDYDESILPPIEQFEYIPVRGQGLYELTLSSSYGDVGRKEIALGPEAFDGYVHQLFTIRENFRRVGNKLKLDKPLKAELRKGPFSFGAVVISEPSRFAEYQIFMLRNIHKPILVPLLYTQFFTSWGSLCEAIHLGEGYTLVADDGENIDLTVEGARMKIAVMLTGDYLLK